MPLEFLVKIMDLIHKLKNIFHGFVSDFDGDDMLGASDLKHVILKLIGNNKLIDSEINLLVQHILEEADLDDDGSLSFAEFEHIIDRSPDFFWYILLLKIVIYSFFKF